MMNRKILTTAVAAVMGFSMVSTAFASRGGNGRGPDTQQSHFDNNKQGSLNDFATAKKITLYTHLQNDTQFKESFGVEFFNNKAEESRHKDEVLLARLIKQGVSPDLAKDFVLEEHKKDQKRNMDEYFSHPVAAVFLIDQGFSDRDILNAGPEFDAKTLFLAKKIIESRGIGQPGHHAGTDPKKPLPTPTTELFLPLTEQTSQVLFDHPLEALNRISVVQFNKASLASKADLIDAGRVATRIHEVIGDIKTLLQRHGSKADVAKTLAGLLNGKPEAAQVLWKMPIKDLIDAGVRPVLAQEIHALSLVLSSFPPPIPTFPVASPTTEGTSSASNPFGWW